MHIWGTSMTESVTHNEELGIIEVHSFNIKSTEDISSLANRVKHISNATDIKKVLVDTLEVDPMPSITDILLFAGALPRNVKIAVLFSQRPLFLISRYIKSAAFFQGISIELFNSKAVAFNWLKR